MEDIRKIDQRIMSAMLASNRVHLQLLKSLYRLAGKSPFDAELMAELSKAGDEMQKHLDIISALIDGQ